VGVDIARAAARMAARRDSGALFAVADLWHGLSLADAGFDVLLNVFAPRNPTEFARVLRPGGLLLVVVPASDHLAELRAAHDLIGVEEEKEQRVAERFGDRFTLSDAADVRYPLRLEPAQLAELLAMTPSARHSQALTPGPSLVTASFRILSFIRNPA
jgi:23S rRNA (guanine745-N1)-methyltransferase